MQDEEEEEVSQRLVQFCHHHHHPPTRSVPTKLEQLSVCWFSLLERASERMMMRANERIRRRRRSRNNPRRMQDAGEVAKSNSSHELRFSMLIRARASVSSISIFSQFNGWPHESSASASFLLFSSLLTWEYWTSKRTPLSFSKHWTWEYNNNNNNNE